MSHPLSPLIRVLFALALVVPATLATSPPAAAVPLAVTVAPAPAAAAPLAAVGACSTGIGNAGGQGIICDVTIVNTITSSGGSATVTVHECLGSAGDPTDGALGHACTTTTATLSAPVTSVIQCNGSGNGGGGKLLCSVVLTNNFDGVSPGVTAATVNQCVGSATTGTVLNCAPTQSTTGAAITQCNGSANGGGASLTCTVPTNSTSASALPITIDQCNGSGNGGGVLINCSASMVSNVVTAAASPSPSASPSAAPSASPSAAPTAAPSAAPSAGTTPPPTNTSPTSGGSSNNSAPPIALLVCFALSALSLAVVMARRRSIV